MERVRMTLELAELAEEMIRARVLREKPDASPEELDKAVARWYAHRPGAEHGDTVGRPVSWPRRRA